MRKRIGAVAALALVLAAAPAEAQLGGRLSVEPFIGYGFFGGLPETNAELEADLAYGGRVAYALGPQWAVFGTFQRSTPEVTGANGNDIDVDHWSGGVEFSYVPRGGAEGMLPILLEAGLGQARYEGGNSDLAVNLGLASALQLTSNIAVRYGVNDYISNYGENDNGIINQIFVRVGAEVSL
jgi:hypothetical protein